MNTTISQQQTTILDCPNCSEQCAVLTHELDAANADKRDVRIACHSCSEVFAANQPVTDPALDIAKCPSCGGEFSVPALPDDDVVQVECPICETEIQSDALDYTNRQAAPKKARRSWLSWFKWGKGSAKKPVTDATPDEASLDDVATDDVSADDVSANDEKVTPLFDDAIANTAAANTDTNADTDTDTDTDTDADTDAEAIDTISAPKKRSRALLASLLVILAGAVAAGAFVIQPDAPARIVDIFTVNQQKPAHFAITNAVYEQVDTAIGNSVVITVTLENTGETNGTPGPLFIELLDVERQSIMQWPVSTTTLDLDAGERRALVTRIFEPPQAFDDIQVTLQQP